MITKECNLAFWIVKTNLSATCYDIHLEDLSMRPLEFICSMLSNQILWITNLNLNRASCCMTWGQVVRMYLLWLLWCAGAGGGRMLDGWEQTVVCWLAGWAYRGGPILCGCCSEHLARARAHGDWGAAENHGRRLPRHWLPRGRLSPPSHLLPKWYPGVEKILCFSQAPLINYWAQPTWKFRWLNKIHHQQREEQKTAITVSKNKSKSLFSA